MKNKLLFTLLTFVALCAFPSENFGQVINLGTAKDFVLFTTVGAVTNTGTTHLTGNVGSNVGSSTGFGNVDGVMHDQDGASAAAGTDLATAYGQLNAAIPTLFPGTLLGNGVTLNAGVYSIPAPTVLNLTLNLDAQNNPNAVFIFQIAGAFSTNAQAKVKLLNGALACNVYWKIEGAVSLATGTTMRGTVIANNAAITMSAGDTLEGRALSINGAVSVTNLFAYTPTGCGSPTLTGPANPVLGTTECFSLFSGIGPVTNSGITNATGDIGTNSGLTTGFNPLLVTGMIHPIPDGVTSQCGTDFTNVYNNINLIPHDIQLLYPAQFGNNLVLTPHTYWMNGAVSFTDTLYLNAAGNPNGVFVIKVNGAFSTSTYSKVILINGAQAKNVYWKIDGAVDINDYSIFRGTIIAQGAINLYTGVTLYGRALTGVGALTTTAVNVIMPTSCAPYTTTEPTNQIVCLGGTATFSVNTTGLGLTYQWRKGNVNLTNGGSISGANTTTLIINPVTALDVASNYNVIISGSFLPNDTSNFASLTLTTAPTITTQPTNQTVCAGDNATFSVIASGSNLTYQWRKGTVNIAGAINTSLILNAVTALDVATNYNVVVTGACAPNDTSNLVSLTLTTAPTITTQPTNQTVCEGNNATFSVIASGSNLTYQWRKGTVNIAGETNATLVLISVTAIDVATNYNVVVTGACAPNDTSNFVSLTLTTAPSITTQPTNQTVCAGNNATFSVIASGSNLSYQWRKGTVNIAGETNATLTLNAVTALDVATNYNVVVTGACAPNDTSNFVSLTLTTAPTITTEPTNQTVCAGNNATFSVIASGSNLTYQWRKGTVNIVGGTNATLTLTSITALDVATNYNVVVSGTCAPTDTSDFVTLTMNVCSIDLSVVKTCSDSTPSIGTTILFTIVARNNSVVEATGVSVIELLQSGYVYVSSSMTAGTYNQTTGIWNIGTLNAETSATLTIAVAVASNGIYSNSVSISGNEPDLTPANDTTTITLHPIDFFIPQGFSPNGDGINDLFVIRGIFNYPNNSITIYNRWGGKVFEASPYTNTWNGTSQSDFNIGGNELPVGTYFYVLDLGNDSDALKGTIYLNK